MALKFENSKIIPIFIEKLINSCSGFHIKTDYKNLIFTKDKVDIANLPKSINTPCEAAEWIVKNNPPKFVKSLSTIAANDQIIVINSNHLCCDGGFLSYILSHFNEDGKAAMFPRMIDDIFGKQLKEAPDPSTHFVNSDTLPRIKWMKNPKIGKESLTDQVYFSHPAKELKCYNDKTKKLHELTESLWAGLSLTLSAMENKFNGVIGCNTCVNLRQMLNKKSIDLSISNGYTRMNIIASTYQDNKTYQNEILNMKMGDIYKLLRKDFETKKKNGSFFTALKLNMLGFPEDPNPGSFGQVTNVGPLKINYPINDFWIQQSVFCKAAERCFSLLSYSKIDDQKGKNDVIFNLRYTPTVTPANVAKTVSQCVDFFLTEIDSQMKVKEALKELSDFQKKI